MMRFIPRATLVALMAGSALLAHADFDGPTPLAWRWAESTSAPPGGTPQVAGDNVYVAVGGRVYCLEKSTGNLVWRFPSGVPIEGAFRNGCILHKDLIVAGADDKSVYGIDAKTGNLRWQHLGDQVATTNVAVAGNAAYYGAVNTLHAIDLSSGEKIWPSGKQIPDGLHPKIDAALDGVVVSTNGGRLLMFNATADKPVWEQRFSRLNLRGSFTVQEDRIYVSTGNYVVALRASTGASIWQQTMLMELAFEPATNDQTVAVVSTDGKVMALNASNGRPMFGKPIELKSRPNVAPSFTGRLLTVPTFNGALNVIDPQAASVVWSYVAPPLVNRISSGSTAGGGAAGGDGPASGGGAAGAAGAAGAGAGGGSTQAEQIVTHTTIAGRVVAAGDSLFALTYDGSLMMFDKNLGVDLTAPEIALLWPRLGEEVAGKAPMEIVFKVQDLGIGVREDSVSVKINGKDYLHSLSNDGFLSVLIVTGGANGQLSNGKATVVVSATDWLGNAGSKTFVLSIDNTLPALGSPPRGDSSTGGTGGGGPRGGGGSRGGGDG